MVICFGYKISPNMIGIQDGYDKNLIDVLRYKGGNVRVMLVGKLCN